MKQINFHSTPEEVQAYRTGETTEAVKELHETAKGHATSKDLQDVSLKLDDVSRATKDNHPQSVVQKLDEVKNEGIGTNEKLATLEKQAEETQGLLEKISKQISQKALPVELLGMEQILIQGNDGEKGEKGDTGENGKDGVDGKDGQSIQGEKGERGDKGEKGDKGIQGERGFKGDKGFDGVDGKDGINGSSDTTDDISKKLNAKHNHLDFRILTNIPRFALEKDIPHYAGNGGGGGQNLQFRDSTGSVISAYVTDIQYGTGLVPTYSNGKIILATSGGTGTVTSVSVTTANGISGSVATATTTPAITLTLGAITPTTVNGNTFTTGTYTLTGQAGKTLTFNGSITLTGTDAQTYTFPATSAIIARTDAANTFTGVQTTTQVLSTNNAITASGNAATIPVTSKINTVTNNSAAALTITFTTAGAIDGQTVIVRIYDFSGVAQTLTLVNTENSTVTPAATTNGSTTLPYTLGLQFNSATTKWRIVASA